MDPLLLEGSGQLASYMRISTVYSVHLANLRTQFGYTAWRKLRCPSAPAAQHDQQAFSHCTTHVVKQRAPTDAFDT